MHIPNEFELLSLFESEPVLLDNHTDGLPFVYNQAKYRFSNGRESFIAIISPASNQFQLTVTDLNTDEIVSYLSLERVDRLEIKADSKDYSAIVITINQDELIQTLQLEFKPRYKSFFKEQLNR